MGCKHLLKLKGGQHDGLTMAISCLASASFAFGCYCDVKDWDEIIKCAVLCNRLGLDFFSVANLPSLPNSTRGT